MGSGSSRGLLPSTVAVARRAAVSVGTVSRVLNGASDVNAELRRRVLKASRELGYVPKTPVKSIAVVVEEMHPQQPLGYVTTMVMSLIEELANHGYLAEITDAENLNHVRQARVNGVLGVVFDERIVSLREVPRLPIIAINSSMMLEHGIHSVSSDHFQQSRLAVEHLLAKGHRRIAFLETRGENWGSCRRLEGYRTTLEAAGVAVEESLIAYTRNQPVHDALDMLVRKGATALVNFSEDSALEVIHILTNIMRLSIPRDISVVSMEDLPVFNYLSPPHTVVVQPLKKLAQVAVEQMLRFCDRRSGSSGGELVDITLPCSLIERASVRDLTRE